MKRFSAFAAASALVFLCTACGGPEPKVYETDIPGLGAEQQAATNIVARADSVDASTGTVAADATE